MLCRVHLDDAIGSSSAELLCPYPPGVPVLFPGELVTVQAVQALRQAVQAGGAVTGASDTSLATLLVISSG